MRKGIKERERKETYDNRICFCTPKRGEEENRNRKSKEGVIGRLPHSVDLFNMTRF